MHAKTPNQLRTHYILVFLAIATLAHVNSTANGDVKLPAIFGDHMVMQQGQANRVWGWAAPGEEVTVALADQRHTATTGDDGNWKVTLDPLSAGGPHELTVTGKNTITYGDVLVGEVWVCSGQSNMEWPVQQAKDADLEARTANFPRMRLITIPHVGTQEPQHEFGGMWQTCSPETVAEFSAVGYFFGRQLHQSLDVPIGLIDNSWGGSACEAWVDRSLLERDDRYRQLMERWAETERTYDHAAVLAEYQERVKKWEEENAPASPRRFRRPRKPPFSEPSNPLAGQHRPGNLYNGALRPVIGYGIRGAIWYQGEANAGRAYQYRHLFPSMIQQWRDEWDQGDFPFYWVQLADFKRESAEPQESAWAELREAQTMTLSELPNTGEAVIIDLGEADDIHPRDKQNVAKRLARWALARDYGVEIAHESPRFKSMEKQDNKITIRFRVSRQPDAALDAFDGDELTGFAIAGEDKKFVWAQARVSGEDRVDVWSDEIADPVAVRYAWADNPRCNLRNRAGLPATPFRTDDWPGVTADVHK
jgi:sialate O-acetylesterase